MDRSGVLALDGYVRLDRGGWYEPGFAGLGQVPAETAGVPVMDIARIDAIQKALVIRSAEVNAADGPLWDTIWAKLKGTTVPGTASPFTGWEWTRDKIVETAKNVLMTRTYFPTESVVLWAENFNRDLQNMVSYYLKMVPEKQSEVRNASADMASRMARVTPLRDPARDGWDAFLKSLEERGQFFAGGLGFGLMAAAAVAALLLLSR